MTRNETLPPRLTRRPRIALMGEFSAGKSTLANVLMGRSLSPTRITATQVPPLWYTKGDSAPIRIQADGTEEPLHDGDLQHAAISDTIAVRVYEEAEILDACDIIDMPGSSDPNITVDIWRNVLPLADAVIWCSPATQAWRQSEAALWEEFAPAMGAYSLLLVTRIDKIRSEADGKRLMSRLARETDGMFRNVFPVSLVTAQAAEDDASLWHDSGMEAVADELLKIIVELEPVIANTPAKTVMPLQQLENGLAGPGTDPAVNRAAERSASGLIERTPQQPETMSAEPETANAAGAVVPKRVTSRGATGARRPRPRRAEMPESLI